MSTAASASTTSTSTLSSNTDNNSRTHRPRRPPRNHAAAPPGDTGNSIDSGQATVRSAQDARQSNRGETRSTRRGNGWRRPDNRNVASGGSVDVSSISQAHPLQSDEGGSSTRPVTPTSSAISVPSSRPNRGGRGRGRSAGRGSHTVHNSASTPNMAEESARPPRPGRRGKFNGSLTDSQDPAASTSTYMKPSEKYSISGPKKDDLTTTLIHNLRTPPYPDCPICFSAIHPLQPTWSCSPSLPIVAEDKENENMQCCWTTFHLKCIRSWASKSVKDVAEAWRARGEDRQGEWRCPGCQAKRMAVPSGYWCFCGSAVDPKPPRLATPHSCANPCARPRVCGHACPLACHPGPCPPCQITIELPCYCGKQRLSYRCSNLHTSKNKMASGQVADLSCGDTCGRKLGCGNHTCQVVCHDGPCPPCVIKETTRCYCGKEERELGCGEGESKFCTVINSDGDEERWTGKFACENKCNRPFDCGIHKCSQPCHPPSPAPPPCPFSPSLVTHCPCGKHELSPALASSFPPGASLTRTKCTDSIPTCESLCMKPLAGCTHVCSVRCHTGACPPCSIALVRPCRCGATMRDIKCAELQAGGEEEILCDRPCAALRDCGRHQCNRLCCPLASLAGVGKGKGKRKAAAVGAAVDGTGLHACDLVCGKVLGCGNHRCEERDHKGPCPPCLRSSFEEMICHCGRTILDPPIPCGTRINCAYPCNRPPPPCGHPKAPHACHEDPAPCPPCVFLTSKRCACGKNTVDNVKCSQEKVSCGTVCGRLLACGFHHCQRLCHGDDCGACNVVCGKPRKLCLPAIHPCTEPCHAPASCPESEPCRTAITITCPCGRIRQSIPCGRSTSNPGGKESSQQLKCSNECLVAKRNARLAAALGISPEKQNDREVSYNDEITAFARANPKFCLLVEKTFGEFVKSEKKTQVLPHMPPERRKFVHDLASVYRMDTQMVDQEPHRSVQLIRRMDTRIPTPLLSSTIMSSTNLGKLTDLRAAPAPRSTSPASVPVTGAPVRRGWTSLVSRPVGSPAANGGGWVADDNARPAVLSSSGPVQSTVAPPWLRQSNGNSTSLVSSSVPDDWEEDI
ncbi:hypothetical protein NEOLEDRAFT_1244899 [Neolentinus lepideus HHB14362 ss-1]|uniref:R3H domain-containing protein n=1 Tax=Neolentinus lepideus HHB14362 ss-1 TaxID=1314782 RepID=A0A165PEP2_9AGAM|nr:hypothetical protein NEOLEDRAFT_1244899 [Neolentinus lepideus HHB14362 ss-1]